MAWCGGSRTAQPESPDRGVLQSDSGYPPSNPWVSKEEDLCENSHSWAQPCHHSDTRELTSQPSGLAKHSFHCRFLLYITCFSFFSYKLRSV